MLSGNFKPPVKRPPPEPVGRFAVHSSGSTAVVEAWVHLWPCSEKTLICWNSIFGPSLSASRCFSRGRTVPLVGGKFHVSIGRQVGCSAQTPFGQATGRPPPPALRFPNVFGTGANQVPLGPRPISPRPPGNTQFSSRILFFGSTCRSRATLPRAAGPLGRRRPGNPRREPCPYSLHGS